MKAVNALLASLSSNITEICRVSGIPGVSLGVIDNGEIVYNASYGYCDVENQIPCSSETTFVLGSLSKAFTSTLLAQLVAQEKLKWSDSLNQILPEFERGESDLSRHVTIADLLSHHSGLAAFDSLWLGSDNIPLLNHSDAVKILSYVPQQQSFRGSFVYNNFAYDVLGRVIEKVSGSSYSSFLRDQLLEPLGMKRTYYTDTAGQVEDEAKPYAALADSTPIRISPALEGENVLMGAAGGVRSSVSDLLLFYNALMDAAAHHMEVNTVPKYTPKSYPLSLSQLPAMWTGWNILPMPLLREHSYGYGWLRAQLPSMLAPSRGNPVLNPLVGIGAPSRLAIWHSGDIPGYQTHVTIFPETNQAIVVLTNSISLNAGSRYISDIAIEALLDNLDNAPDYTKLARMTADIAASRMESVHTGLLRGRKLLQPRQPLRVYTGRYFNAAQNFFIEISLVENDLYLAFMGREKDTFKLVTYGDDSFFWFLTHDEAAALARYDGYGEDFYIIRFGAANGQQGTMDTLWWKHEPALDGYGEAFERRGENAVVAGPNSEL
ncbi:Beta-lactamase/transpeptidase-like protein [Cordyceps fumosorosea ARSEF 2679]|uniref:Beta-lactamase/transpeptidase-like protein n=1 Tax=Cordyceps fumosorosea (strain ARSEF 2679) TaxID=1081104 RepID=A0A167EAG7_CORFA|nr:Beta-lactamase/transpeptidase-like protein [Cordyceps fumosorosea ARSEF 2679]OAA43582.1 Beta-lactamase/transpeptidase-like protein [Cordyceps fumosorosea ARSEF 2679]